MNEIDIERADLNLLAALHALLEEGGVTPAARRLGIGQPAASHALARARELFGDPLLVRSGRGMVPTPRGEALRAPLARLLADATRLVRHGAEFDPRSSTRRFVLACPDLLAPVLPAVMARLRDAAPRARLEVSNRTADAATQLDRYGVDTVLGPLPERGPGVKVRGLGSVHFSVVARVGHPALGKSGRRLSVRAWTRHPHVMVRSGSSSRSFVGEALARAGLEREVALVVPSFLSALVTVAETDLFFAAPRELVQPLAERLGVVVVPAPVEVPAIPVAASWHERMDADLAARFFRRLVCGVVESALRGAVRRRV